MSFHFTNALGKYEPLFCKNCYTDLLIKKESSLVVFVKEVDGRRVQIIDLHWSCKGECASNLRTRYIDKKKYEIVEQELSEILNPFNFVSWSLGAFDMLHRVWNFYNDSAFSNLKDFYAISSQSILRDATDEELNEIKKKNK